MSKKQLAAYDYNNHYYLWDKDATMGCKCDAGYYGSDCSERKCKVGVDPLYLDDSATIKYSTWNFAIVTTSPTIDFTDGTPLEGSGHYAIRFYDSSGEDWLTAPIEAKTSVCEDIITALEALPNNVIPAGQTYCTMTEYSNKNEQTWKNTDSQTISSNLHIHEKIIFYQMSFWEAQTEWDVVDGAKEETITDVFNNYDGSGFLQKYFGFDPTGEALSGIIYTIKFYGNPGALKQPEIELYLDGNQPALSSPNGKLITKVWTDGQQGEDNDYFADHCDGVTISWKWDAVAGVWYFSGLTPAEKLLLKACLGSSDFDMANNQEVYNWDKGDMYYPHLVKLVKSTAVYTDGGYYVAIYYSEKYDIFVAMNAPFPLEESTLLIEEGFGILSTDIFEVYTTTGTLALTSNYSSVQFGFGSKTLYMGNTSYDMQSGNSFDGDLSCEVGLNNADKFQYINHCLNKSDIITFLNWGPIFNTVYSNPMFINLYTVERLHQRPYMYTNTETYGSSTNIGTADTHFMTHMIDVDISTNWGATGKGVGHNNFRVYKFFPGVKSTYNYVAECSNRGICDSTSGVCKCFPGYTNDDCSVQNSISL